MNCPECQSPVDENKSFCPNCGARLNPPAEKAKVLPLPKVELPPLVRAEAAPPEAPARPPASPQPAAQSTPIDAEPIRPPASEVNPPSRGVTLAHALLSLFFGLISLVMALWNILSHGLSDGLNIWSHTNLTNLVLSIYWLFSGVIQIFAGIIRPSNRLLNLAAGLLSTLAGLLLSVYWVLMVVIYYESFPILLYSGLILAFCASMVYFWLAARRGGWTPAILGLFWMLFILISLVNREENLLPVSPLTCLIGLAGFLLLGVAIWKPKSRAPA